MQICSGKYTMRFQNGGIEVLKDGSLLYYYKRPMYAFIQLLNFTMHHTTIYLKQMDGLPQRAY